jgi:hypothetical protein
VNCETGSDDDMLDITTSDGTTILRGRGPSGGRRRQSTTNRARSLSNRPLKKSPMEEQAFLSTLPLRIKNRRRRTSTTLPKSDKPSTSEPTIPDTAGHDTDATSSDDEPDKPRKTKKVEGTMTPAGLVTNNGFVGLSGGKDALNVQFVSPIKELDAAKRPDLVDGSRFYVKRRIKISNTSRFIPEGISPVRRLSDSSKTKFQDGEIYS